MVGSRYEAPFPIFHDFEGDRYVPSKTRNVVGSRFLPKSIIEKMSMTNVMDKLLKSIWLKKFVNLENDSYVQLTQEFYCSLVINDMDKTAINFCMLGHTYQLNPNFHEKCV